MNVELRTVPSPDFGCSDDRPQLPPSEYETRMEKLYQAAQVDWVFIYGDREHYANLVYLVNLDPRFEEVILILGPQGKRVLVLGNEDLGYTSVVPVEVETVLLQSLSLMGQDRTVAPRMIDILRSVGFRTGQSVSMIGWKYLEPEETSSPQKPAFIPMFFVDVVRDLVGDSGRITDGTSLMLHPQGGLRTRNSADQLAVFEWAGRNSAAYVFNVLQHARPGMTERQAMQTMLFAGDPWSMHPIFSTGSGAVNGLRSASGKVIEYGDAVNLAVGLWGSLVCRAGLFLGAPDQTFFDEVAAPYFNVIATWYRSVGLGVRGGDLFQAILQAFSGSRFQSLLNPGHLTSYDEWTHSPIRPGSAEVLQSGMVLQADIIPSPMRPGELINCEDTIALADESLRAEIRSRYPEMWRRIRARRQMMMEHLGLTLADEILPLSDGAAYLPPFWLIPNCVCAVKKS